MAQKAHLFHGQLRVKRNSNELLPPSLGGLYTPVSNLYCESLFSILTS
jgi:hypothetical protein